MQIIRFPTQMQIMIIQIPNYWECNYVIRRGSRYISLISCGDRHHCTINIHLTVPMLQE